MKMFLKREECFFVDYLFKSLSGVTLEAAPVILIVNGARTNSFLAGFGAFLQE